MLLSFFNEFILHLLTDITCFNKGKGSTTWSTQDILPLLTNRPIPLLSNPLLFPLLENKVVIQG